MKSNQGDRRFPFAGILAIVVLSLGSLSAPVHAQFGQSGRPGLSPGAADDSPLTNKRPPRVPYYEPDTDIQVKEVRVTGNQSVKTETIQSMLQTRSGRLFDEEQVQADVRKLINSKMFRDVRAYNKEAPDGVIVTFQVFEQPVVQHVHFVGNENEKDKKLTKEVGIKVGDSLHRYSVEEGKRRLEDYYHGKGYGRVHVKIIEGTNTGDVGVAYSINEGPKQRIFKTKIVGNTIDSEARLRTKVLSKPGKLWLFGGKLNEDQLDEDVDRLYAYYHSLGFFQARIGRHVEFNDDEDWATVVFTVDEGPRFRVKDIRIVGCEKFSAESLQAKLQMEIGDYFNLSRLQEDLNMLRDLYGSSGYMFAKIDPQTRFAEEGGELDLVFNIDEGQRWRINEIHVNIAGDTSHTQRTVVLNRLSIRPGDYVNSREIRNSERRLQSSQLFEVNPARGQTPSIVVKPASGYEAIAGNDTESSLR
ncbi:MAG: hypothetical protein KDA60_00235 [Planctomycetales bacterium]|nr:hypothetical protein [Planctomycetales bacterium]